MSSEKGHEFVITTGTVTKGRRFITGTSSCSYLVQEENGGDLNWLYALILTILVVILVTFGIGVGQIDM